jgi:predicted TIM-barrel fold metal-dependent hydrolase
MHVEDVALAFPDLKIVMTHVGNPWVPEVVALLAKYPNLYMMTSGWAPKYIPAELRDFLTSSRGARKVMWSSDYPLLTLKRTLREAREWGLDAETEARFLGLNALAVFGSDATRARAGVTAAA